MAKSRLGIHNAVDVSNQPVFTDEEGYAASDAPAPSAVDGEMNERVAAVALESPLPPNDVAVNLAVETTEAGIDMVKGTASDGVAIVGARLPIERDTLKEPAPPRDARQLTAPTSIRRSQAGVKDWQIEELLGKALYDQIARKARGNNIASVADFVSQNLYHAINTGAFSAAHAEDVREGNDHAVELRAAFGDWVADRIMTDAAERNHSNLAVLRTGIDMMVRQNLL